MCPIQISKNNPKKKPAYGLEISLSDNSIEKYSYLFQREDRDLSLSSLSSQVLCLHIL